MGKLRVGNYRCVHCDHRVLELAEQNTTNKHNRNGNNRNEPSYANPISIPILCVSTHSCNPCNTRNNDIPRTHGGHRYLLLMGCTFQEGLMRVGDQFSLRFTSCFGVA